MDSDIDTTFQKLHTIKGNKRKLLDFVGSKSIISFIKENPELNNIDRAYETIRQLYNEEVDRVNEETRIRNEIQEQLNNNTDIREYISPYEGNITQFYDDLKSVHSEGINVNVYKQGGSGGIYELNFNYRFTNSFSSDYKYIFNNFLMISSDENRLDNDTEDYTLYINTGIVIEPNFIEQHFKQGDINCVFKAMSEWAKNKMNLSTHKRAIQRYKKMYNDMINDETKYRSSGVSENDLYQLANKYQVNINVCTPLQEKFITANSNKKALTTFNLMNTRIDHVDHLVNLKSKKIPQKELNKLGKTLLETDEFFIYKQNCDGYSWISTSDGTYEAISDYKNEIQQFEKDTGLEQCRLDDFVDKDISQFIRQGCHFNETVDMKDDIYIDKDGENVLNPIYEEFTHIDKRKAYTAYKLCKYYDGFLGKVTDLRRCDHIVDIGYYLIKNINFNNANPRLKIYNDKMNIYNDNVWPSPDLKFLMDNGVTFDIIAGCWGSKMDFDFTENMVHSRKQYPDEPSWYAKWTGQSFYKNDYTDFYMKGDKELAEHIKACEQTTSRIDYNEFKNEIKVSYKKASNKHLSHVTGFIVSYARLNVMEQLLSMEPDNVIKIVVDAIYYTGDDVTLKNCFRHEYRETISKNIPGRSFISNDKLDIDLDYDAEYREHHMKELHEGPGGSGKTHNLLIDNGFQKVLYCAPSWKLSRQKAKEYSIQNDVWANILSDDQFKIDEYNKKYNVLIVDEVSMMTNAAKLKLFKNYPNMKLLFCGDIGFQLPSFEENAETMSKHGFDYIKTYTKNHRCQCDKLLRLLTMCRKNINNQDLYNMVKEQLPKITKEELTKQYTINDMILTRSIKKRDEYTDLLNNHKKYYILKTDINYCKGEILHEKPCDDYKINIDYELRHAYTIHSIQGETAKHMLYIHDSYMEPSAIYTALSRARYLSQVKMIV